MVTGALRSEAEHRLLQAWRFGTAEDVGAAMDEFRLAFHSNIISAMPGSAHKPNASRGSNQSRLGSTTQAISLLSMGFSTTVWRSTTVAWHARNCSAASVPCRRSAKIADPLS